MRLFRYQIILNYNSITTLLGTFILKMVTNYQHVTYIYTHFERSEKSLSRAKGGILFITSRLSPAIMDYHRLQVDSFFLFAIS